MSAFPFVYLASQSPRRQALLDQIGVAYKVLLPTDAEAAEALEAVLPQESALRYVKRVTRLKVLAALEQIQLQSLGGCAGIVCRHHRGGGRAYIG
jgi:septum formation protein